MFGLIRLCLYFIFSTLVLSIPIKNKPLFYSVQKYSMPITKSVLSRVHSIYTEILSSGEVKKHYKKKVDKISSSLSSTIRRDFKNSPKIEQRKNFFITKEHEPHDKYDHDERILLEKILERE